MNRIVWLMAGIAVAVYICGPIVDPDLWWHITVGRWILGHAQLPQSDHWNMFALGTPWRAYSWAPEIVFALVDSSFGVHGLLVLKVVLALLLTLSLMYCLGVMARDHFIGALLGIYCAAASFNHFTLRPQTLVWVYFIWLLLVLFRIEDQGWSRQRAAALLLIMAAWANTHLTSIIAVAASFLWLSSRGKMRRAAQVAALSVLGTLITPYLGGEWLTMFSKSLHPFSHSAIAEFQPATILQYSTGFLLVIGAVLLAFAHKAPAVLERGKLFLCLLLVVAGLAVVKFLPFAVIALAAAIAVLWGRTMGEVTELGNLAEGLRRLRGLTDRLAGPGLAFLFICTAVVNLSHVWEKPLSFTVTPVEAVDFIRAHDLPHPILNSFGRGGYLMYRFSDEAGDLAHPVPIDGRTNVTPPDVWEKFIAAFDGKQSWREYIERVDPRTILWESGSPFTSLLLTSEDWCRVLQTGDAQRGFSVFLRRDEFFKRTGALQSDDCGQAQMLR